MAAPPVDPSWSDVIRFVQRSRLVRWCTPVLVLGLFVGVARLNASKTRRATVPVRNTAEVIALVGTASAKPHSGTFTLSTNLGLGAIAASVSGNQLVSLAGGSNLARVWSDGATRSRVALLQPLQETDWIQNATGTWVWQSSVSQAAHVSGPTTLAVPALGALGALTALVGETSVEPPDVVASRLLTLSNKSGLSLSQSDYVAGRRAYELTMVPHSQVSLITHVTIAVDASTGLPLRVVEYVRGQGAPIVDDRFQSVSFSQPAASNFEFHPPPNARVFAALTLGAALNPPRRIRRDARLFGTDGGGDREFGGPASIRIDGKGWDEVVVATGVPDFNLGDLFRTATRVSGAFGRGLLVRTSALSVLFLRDDGLVAGVVTPERLEAALSHGRPAG